MKFLFIISLLIILFVFLFGFSILRMLFSAIFGINSKPSSRSQNPHREESSNKQQKQQSRQTKKIITPDEGEYVDYEEVKD